MAATGFGNLSFGAATTNPPAFGATATPSLFGGSMTTATPAFGASSAAPAFGTTTSTFGAAPAFGSTTFGAASTAASTGFGGFGTTTTTAAPSLGFGSTFGATAAPAFGTGSTFGTGTAFGAPAASTGSLFGGGFGTQQPAGGTTFNFNSTPAFGAKPATTSLGFGSTFGQPAAQPAFGQPQQPQPPNPDEAFAQSIVNVSVFGDERDTILARWNYLQAMWGIGKSFYSQQLPPVDITPENYLCRFKAMGYNQLPGKDNKMGLVALTCVKSVAEVKDQQQQFVANFNQLLGNKPNIVVNVDSVKALSDKKTQINIYVEEKSTTSNETRRILATELNNFLNQPQTKQQLTTQLSIENSVALVLPDEDQLKEYLDNPPKGIDPRMWRQAKADNPDTKKLIPVPMIGFQELKWRLKCQEQETDTHHTYLSNVEKEITALKQRHANTSAKIMEHRRKFAELSHRILKIIVRQESTRKLGQALSPEEEIIRTKLENMQALVSAPTQFKGRLSELLSQMRMQRNQWAHVGTSAEYTLDKESSEEMKSFLTMQQRAMNFLIETVNRDLKDLTIIREGMVRMVPEYPQQVFN